MNIFDEIAKKFNVTIPRGSGAIPYHGVATGLLPYSFVASYAKHQEEVIKVMMLLPTNKYRFEQVEAAINASGASPYTIYMLLAANDRTETLTKFYEALNGPGGNTNGR